MNNAVVKSNSWPRRRLLEVAGLIFIVQLALIFGLSDHKPATARSAHPAPLLRFADRATAALAPYTDPTFLALPHRDGFSGNPWMVAPEPPKRFFEWSENPRTLALDVQQLGALAGQFFATNRADLARDWDLPPPELAASGLVAGSPEETDGKVLIEGALAGRRLVEPISGKPWPGSELLANTIVQLLVDANGRPVSATLLASSGVPEADRFALEGAQKLRFAPLPNKSEGPPSAPGNMSLGRIVFQWQTVPEPSNGDSQKTK